MKEKRKSDMKLFVEITSEEYEQLKDIHEWNKRKYLLEERNTLLEYELRRFQKIFPFDAINRCLWVISEARRQDKSLSREEMNNIYEVLKYFSDISEASCL